VLILYVIVCFLCMSPTYVLSLSPTYVLNFELIMCAYILWYA
jgi:hypothetical protein